MRRTAAAICCTRASSERPAHPRSMTMRTPLRGLILGGLLAGSVLAAVPAHAQGLFDDNEARRRISNLRSDVEAAQKAMEERFARIDAALQDKRALVDLAGLIEGLKQDMNKLRGQIEVVVNQNENLERRQRDLYVDLDARLRKMEQTQAQITEKLAQPERDAQAEKTAYESALNQFKVGNYQSAVAGFQTFMVNFPNSQLVPSAQYWVGNSYYALRDYKVAIAAQEKVVASWPENAKAPDALLNIASSQVELGDQKSARETLKILLTKYPNSPAAEQAKQRLGGRR